MNANELADRLEKILQHENSWDIDLVETIAMLAAPMLRQQQAEIEALKNENQYFKDRLHSLETLRKAQDK